MKGSGKHSPINNKSQQERIQKEKEEREQQERQQREEERLKKLREEEREREEKKRLEKEFMRETLDKLDKQKMEIFNKTALKQYSPKYLEILKQIQDTNHVGLHLVYSNFVTLEGIGLFKFALEANGFKELNIQKKNQEWELDDHWENDKGNPKFIIYSGNQTTEERDILLKIYNGDLANLPSKIAMKLKSVDKANKQFSLYPLVPVPAIVVIIFIKLTLRIRLLYVSAINISPMLSANTP
jgi:hypothetical protein